MQQLEMDEIKSSIKLAEIKAILLQENEKLEIEIASEKLLLQ